jgi:hypothetical protein
VTQQQLPAGWVWYVCTRKGCGHRVPAHPATTFVAHQVKGDEHPMKKEKP